MKAFLSSFLPEGRLANLLLASAGLGIVIGFLVYLYDYVVEEQILKWLFELPLAWQASIPFIGLTFAALVIRYIGTKETTPLTSDEFIREFHEKTPNFRLRDLPAKIIASISTIGSGGALGLEGPSIYMGSSLGIHFSRIVNWFRREERKTLMVAGAAAGIAAIFKAPATGVIFALESPYRDDTSRRALLPALIAAAFSFVIFAFASDTEAIFKNLSGTSEESIDLVSLGGGAAVGIVAGLTGRFFAYLVRMVKEFKNRTTLVYRLILGGICLAGLVVLSDWLFESPLSLGPGGRAAEWAISPTEGLGFIALLFGIRMLATLTTIGMNGVGGLFIPLASLGIIMGSFIGDLVGQGDSTLYPILGLAAFLGAGYRVPFTAVVFVAEATFGSPFIVPALIASALSQVVAGPASVASFQRVERMGHLERRLSLPITAAITTDVLSVPLNASIREFVDLHVLGNRTTEVPVVENGIYIGMCTWRAATEIDQSLWDETTIVEIYDPECPCAKATWKLQNVVASMEKEGMESMAVVDADGNLTGMVYDVDIIKLRDLLDEAGG